MRPIDADAFFENLTGYAAPEMVWDAGDIEHKLDEMPTLTLDDLRPKGEWIGDGYDDIPCTCSHCGGEAHYTRTFQEQFDYDWEENLVSIGYEEIRDYIRSEYCPHCGAKMGDGK